MLERYDDQTALDAHRAAPHFKELGRKLGDYLAGRPDVQVMQEV
jgi:quinol monooxygenase YgiN